MTAPHDTDTPDSDPKRQRIIEARMKLKARFENKMQESPAMADDQPQGEGPANRHGMPQVPVGQIITKKWPVLDLGHKPNVTQDSWKLVVDGAVSQELILDWDQFLALEQVEDVSDFHCVTTWSKLDMHWKGVRLSEIAAMAGLLPDATHLMIHGYDGYETNIPLEEAFKDDVLLVHTVDGEPLPHEHGGPVRMITPQLYAWKGAKWVSRLEFMTADRPGFWERNGYSNTAHPWRNDRYSR